MIRFWLFNTPCPNKVHEFAHELDLGSMKGVVDDSSLLA